MTPTEKALLTWYEVDNPKYLDQAHPQIKLAGEIGELLDLYAKHLFKPNFDWMDCKCGLSKNSHPISLKWYQKVLPWLGKRYCIVYKSKAIDELGDIWYYLRILTWQNEIELVDYYAYSQDELSIIKEMYSNAAAILDAFDNDTVIEALQEIYELLLLLLEKSGYTIEQLTESNYQKLNSDPTNHGWTKAQ